MPLVSVHHLTKIFQSVRAVEDVSFSLEKGEVYGLIGPNGSGKTTIIKMIAGLYEPTGGSISIDGHDRFAHRESVNARIGYIPDASFVYEYITGREYLDFVRMLYDVDADTYRDQLSLLLRRFPIEGILDESVEAYSRGNKQKLMIIAAFMHRPDIVLIDEPVVGLDVASSAMLADVIGDFRSRGGAMLVTTHTLDFLDDVVDRVGVLRDGRLVAEGTTDELRRQSNLNDESDLEDIYTALTATP